MAFLAVATALVGLIAATNLMLTLGVVRRLREHTAELADLRSGRIGEAGDGVALPAGSPIGAFEAVSVDGDRVTLDSLGHQPLVAFFSPHCTPCKEKLPAFVDHAALRPGGRAGVLAVVVGSPAEAAEVVGPLKSVATVVVEPDQGAVQTAFAVTGFPAFALVEEGTVAASGYELARVLDPDAATLAAAG